MYLFIYSIIYLCIYCTWPYTGSPCRVPRPVTTVCSTTYLVSSSGVYCPHVEDRRPCRRCFSSKNRRFTVLISRTDDPSAPPPPSRRCWSHERRARSRKNTTSLFIPQTQRPTYPHTACLFTSRAMCRTTTACLQIGTQEHYRRIRERRDKRNNIMLRKSSI